MKVLIIGGSGFIGTHLVGSLIGQNKKVKIYDKVVSKSYPEQTAVGDIRDYQALRKEISDFDVIYDLAAEHRDDVRPSSLYYDVNVGGAKNIVKAAKAENVRKIIFTSTVAIYGLNKVDTSEIAEPDPFNDYGRSKLQAEVVYRKWVEENSENTLVTIRPTAIFGENNKGNLHTLIKQISDNKFLMVGSGINKKSIAYVGNLVEFMINALNLPNRYHLYNFADKPDLTMKQLVEIIHEKLNKSRAHYPSIPFSIALVAGYIFDAISLVSQKQYPISSVRMKKFCADTQISINALEEFGYIPSYSIEVGLERTINSILRSEIGP